jgi:hypothetical protein
LPHQERPARLKQINPFCFFKHQHSGAHFSFPGSESQYFHSTNLCLAIQLRSFSASQELAIFFNMEAGSSKIIEHFHGVDKVVFFLGWFIAHQMTAKNVLLVISTSLSCVGNHLGGAIDSTGI